jgi:hypothetical protein
MLCSILLIEEDHVAPLKHLGEAMEEVAKTFRPLTSVPFVVDTAFEKDRAMRGDAVRVRSSPVMARSTSFTGMLSLDNPSNVPSRGCVSLRERSLGAKQEHRS